MADLSFSAYLSKMQRARKDIMSVLADAAEASMLEAVRATMDATPPKAGTGRGPFIGSNMITGQLKQHWATDSTTKPIVSGQTITTALANDMQYASYVNDGHRMDRHFVPGLYVNPDSGLLEYDPDADVGLTVGTKTKYVKGEFMADKGRKAYQNTLAAVLGVKVKELLR